MTHCCSATPRSLLGHCTPLQCFYLPQPLDLGVSPHHFHPGSSVLPRFAAGLEVSHCCCSPSPAPVRKHPALALFFLCWPCHSVQALVQLNTFLAVNSRGATCDKLNKQTKRETERSEGSEGGCAAGQGSVPARHLLFPAILP